MELFRGSGGGGMLSTALVLRLISLFLLFWTDVAFVELQFSVLISQNDVKVLLIVGFESLTI
jgi:hypothetical protein